MFRWFWPGVGCVCYFNPHLQSTILTLPVNIIQQVKIMRPLLVTGITDKSLIMTQWLFFLLLGEIILEIKILPQFWQMRVLFMLIITTTMCNSCHLYILPICDILLRSLIKPISQVMLFSFEEPEAQRGYIFCPRSHS